MEHVPYILVEEDLHRFQIQRPMVSDAVFVEIVAISEVIEPRAHVVGPRYGYRGLNAGAQRRDANGDAELCASGGGRGRWTRGGKRRLRSRGVIGTVLSLT